MTATTKSFLTATHWGIVRGTVDNGRIVSITPFEGDKWPSPNINRLIERVYSDKRILHPLVRKGWLKDGPSSRVNRGHDEFVEVSWDEALDLAAREIKRIYTEHGPAAVFGRSYGWKSTGAVNSSVNLCRRLLSLCGGYIPCHNSYSTAAISAILPYVVGMSDPCVPSWGNILKDSECVVFWGSDPLITNDIDWCTTIHEGKDYLKKLKASGIETLCINPVKTETAKLIGSDWIGLPQGTDTALMLGLIVTLIDQGLEDKAFLEKCTFGWQAFSDYALGKTDGVKKDARWAAGITGLREETIVNLALKLKTKRSLIMLGWGPQRAKYGEQVPSMAYALAAVLGHIGKPGGGIGTHYHYCDGGVPVAKGVPVAEISARFPAVWWHEATQNRLPDVIPIARFADCFLNPGKTIEYNGRTVTYPDVKLVVWSGGNPFSHQPDTGKVARAFQKPETVIVVDSVMNATVEHADIILPACTTFERNDITGIGTYTHAGICAMQQAIAPMGQSRSDWEIFSDLSDRLGLGLDMTEGLSESERIRLTYLQTQQQAAAIGVELPSFEEFWDKGVILFDKDASKQFDDPWQLFRADSEHHRLATPSGKIELFSSRLAAMHYDDVPPHPAYLSDDLLKKSAANAGTYPLVLMSIKGGQRLHSQLDDTLNKTRHGMEPCRIHPSDAKVRSIQEGDVIRVFNSHGSVLATAELTDGILEGTVAMSHGAWYTPLACGENEIDGAGCSNTLVPDESTSRLSGGNIASGAHVEVQKFQEI